MVLGVGRVDRQRQAGYRAQGVLRGNLALRKSILVDAVAYLGRQLQEWGVALILERSDLFVSSISRVSSFMTYVFSMS
jgi:hypothetical protein